VSKVTQPVFRTTIVVQVLSQGAPFHPGDGGLKEVDYFISEDAGIGDFEVTKIEPVPAEEVEDALISIGNDGTFFDDPFLEVGLDSQ